MQIIFDSRWYVGSVIHFVSNLKSNMWAFLNITGLFPGCMNIYSWLTTLLGCFDGQLFGNVLSWWETERSAVLFIPTVAVQMKCQCSDGRLWRSFLPMNVTILVCWRASSHVRYRHTLGCESRGYIHLGRVAQRQWYVKKCTLFFFFR